MSGPLSNSWLEQRLQARDVPAGSEAFRSRLLVSMDEALAEESDRRPRSSPWQAYVTMAACLLIGLSLSQIATSADLLLTDASRPAQRSEISAASLRRISPDLSEADVRRVALFESAGSDVLVLPIPQPNGGAIGARILTREIK